MNDEKQSESSRRYYNYECTCPTYGMKAESKYFPAPLRVDRCHCCGRPKGKNPGTECDYTMKEL